MSRADEDRFCDALDEEFGPSQVIRSQKTSPTPNIEWRRRITDFATSFQEWSRPDVAHTVLILFPWPGWELQGEKQYWGKKLAGYQEKSYPPLVITFERTALLGVEWFTDVAWRREALIAGQFYANYDSNGPYVDVQKDFIRRLYRIVRRMTTNRLKLIRYDADGNKVLEQAIEKGGRLWAGDDAMAWVRADEDRLLSEQWALNRDTGVVRYGYRPLD